MGTVNTTLMQEAESIFTDLGYAVSTAGGEMRAERKWRVVQVTPMAEPDDPPASSGQLRCFVTWAERVGALERRLTRADPDYDWAIIGIRDDEEYVVSRRSS
ncbi:hypothetical protein BRC65_05690 [Halobacteriales archaeon QH_2_65_14]|nr:MAG: hypothetical protein BRC65_05690 [Halobacteriales archaeon QH_2_65_14]